jgi:hypothetical protein
MVVIGDVVQFCIDAKPRVVRPLIVVSIYPDGQVYGELLVDPAQDSSCEWVKSAHAPEFFHLPSIQNRKAWAGGREGTGVGQWQLKSKKGTR